MRIMADKTMDAYEERDAELDEKLAEVLIAISVISKRLAKKITAKKLYTLILLSVVQTRQTKA